MTKELTEGQRYNLVYIMEEAGEVTQAASKIFRFGAETLRKNKEKTNAQLLEEELGDLIGISRRLAATGIISLDEVERHANNKVAKLQEWEHASCKADK